MRATRHLLDFMISGCYYPTCHDLRRDVTRNQYRVQRGGSRSPEQSNGPRRVLDVCRTGTERLQKTTPTDCSPPCKPACASDTRRHEFSTSPTDIDPMWPVFAKSLRPASFARHIRARPALADVRRRRAALDKAGIKDPPVIIAGRIRRKRVSSALSRWRSPGTSANQFFADVPYRVPQV